MLVNKNDQDHADDILAEKTMPPRRKPWHRPTFTELSGGRTQSSGGVGGVDAPFSS